MTDANNFAPRNITLTNTYLTGRESAYVQDAITRGFVGGGCGHYTKACENFLEERLNAQKIFLTSSCTAALYFAGQVLGLNQESEIIVPSYSFASCASAFQSLGAKIVFADSRPDTMNIDEKKIEQLITQRTRSILVVHYAGVSCDMEPLLKIAAKYGIHIIEDAAHGLFGTHRGKPLGTIGSLGAFSFDFAKNVTCGEGGALVVNDPALIESAEIIYHRGTNRGLFMRGIIEKYEWIGAGGNYSPSELQTAFLLGQLEGSDHIQQRRKEITTEYELHLRDWALENEVCLPVYPDYCDSAYHLFYILLKTLDDRTLLIKHLAARGVSSSYHYMPLHLAPAGRQFRAASCNVAEDISTRLLRLPLHPGMTDEDVQYVISAVTSFNCQKGIIL